MPKRDTRNIILTILSKESLLGIVGRQKKGESMSATALTRTEPKVVKGPHTPAFVRQVADRLPAMLEERTTLQQTIEDNSKLWGLFNALPVQQLNVYQQRIAELNGDIEGLSRYEKALSLGYSPYTPPADWYVGLVDNRDRQPLGVNPVTVSLIFSAPMPDAALKELRKAKASGLFSTFLVAAPDRALFERTMPLYVDPVLIGYVHTKSQTSIRNTWDPQKRNVGPGVIADGVAGFLIAYWDLEKDLQFMRSR